MLRYDRAEHNVAKPKNQKQSIARKLQNKKTAFILYFRYNLSLKILGCQDY